MENESGQWPSSGTKGQINAREMGKIKKDLYIFNLGCSIGNS